MKTNPIRGMTSDEYLAFERASEVKHEYLGGQIVAMGGAKRNHNTISTNLGGLVWQHLKGRDCESYSNDMRVHLPATSEYVYPDLSIVCGEPIFQDAVLDTLINPLLLVEILSDSTEGYDRGLKFQLYRGITSLREYILVSQDQPRIEKYTKQGDGFWMLSDAAGIESEITLEPIQLIVRLSDVYDKVDFAYDDQSKVRPV